MPPVVIDLNRAEDPRDVVHRAVEALAAGKLVAFPTETVYGVAASALNSDAIHRLVEAKGRDAGKTLTLAVKSADDARDYVPDISTLARRLARRCWPGPVTLVLSDRHRDSATRQLPGDVQSLVKRDDSIGLRVPAHPLILSVLRLIAGPLALSSANLGGQPDAVTAQEVLEIFGDKVDLVLDDGRCKFGQPSSVVRVLERELEILRPGVITIDNLRRLSSMLLLLVCTGNTCRSPMAEVLAKKQISDRLGCQPDELADQGVWVMSAGTSAMAGGRSTAEAVNAMSERSLDLTPHESQPVSDQLIRFADYVLTMTHGHREAIVAHWPDAAERTFLLSRDACEIADPIGGPLELYRRCAQQIDTQLASWIDEFDFESIPTTIREKK